MVKAVEFVLTSVQTIDIAIWIKIIEDPVNRVRLEWRGLRSLDFKTTIAWSYDASRISLKRWEVCQLWWVKRIYNTNWKSIRIGDINSKIEGLSWVASNNSKILWVLNRHRRAYQMASLCGNILWQIDNTLSNKVTCVTNQVETYSIVIDIGNMGSVNLIEILIAIIGTPKNRVRTINRYRDYSIRELGNKAPSIDHDTMSPRFIQSGDIFRILGVEKFQSVPLSGQRFVCISN